MALFIALGGTAYAAVKLKPNQVKAVNIANQAVTNAKIKTQAVTSGKIKNGGVVNADLGAGAVTGSKIAKEAVTSGALAKNSVTNAKIGAEAVATGKIGNEAITSGKISAGVWNQLVKDVTYESSTSVNDSETEKNTTATCPQGKEAIGGGARINAPAGVQVAINGSYPAVASNNARTGWIASGRETAAEAGNWQVVAYVVCASL
jgi:hypothetical protein